MKQPEAGHLGPANVQLQHPVNALAERHLGFQDAVDLVRQAVDDGGDEPLARAEMLVRRGAIDSCPVRDFRDAEHFRPVLCHRAERRIEDRFVGRPRISAARHWLARDNRHET